MINLNITFLGTGASIPTSERGFPSTLFRYKESGILIDCGDGTTKQLNFVKEDTIKKINFIFVTHEHFDHYSGIGGFLYASCVYNRKKPLWIYGSTIVIDNIKIIFKMLMKEIPFPIHLEKMKEGFLLDYKGLNISSFYTKHSIESYGFIFNLNDENKKNVKKIVYISDTIFFENLINVAKNADLLITECSFLDEEIQLAQKHNHLTLSDVIKIKKESNSRVAILNHVSRRYKLSEIENCIKEDNIFVSFDLFNYNL